MIHKFEILEINGKNAILTTNKWNQLNKIGGKLLIQCVSLIIKNGGSINLNGLGYKGATQPEYQGESYLGKQIKSNKSNYGGGGGSWFGGRWGAGGGYGTKGIDGCDGCGGNTYGTNKLTLKPDTLYLGSGGGCGRTSVRGTNGGGALFIECSNKLLIEKNCKIMVNGESYIPNLINDYNGCGSGGSIYLRSPIFINYGIIEAIGGITRDNSYGGFGCGGMGRIRIDCNELKNNKNIVYGQITPKIGYTGIKN